MTGPINRKIIISILTFILIILIFAFVIEYKLGHQPCKLCFYERVPYFLSIFLILKILFIRGYEKITLLILSIVFVFSSVLAFYHFGIEQGFFKESLVCKTESLSENLSKKELLQQLKQNSVSCKDVSFRILGLSLAAINTIFSLILSFVFIKLFMNCKKN
tara:strand:- start:1363 stop:1845 length:483 start_codon:yes stop_codon:yes gene_type:complete